MLLFDMGITPATRSPIVPNTLNLWRHTLDQFIHDVKSGCVQAFIGPNNPVIARCQKKSLGGMLRKDNFSSYGEYLADIHVPIITPLTPPKPNLCYFWTWVASWPKRWGFVTYSPHHEACFGPTYWTWWTICVNVPLTGPWVMMTSMCQCSIDSSPRLLYVLVSQWTTLIPVPISGSQEFTGANPNHHLRP